MWAGHGDHARQIYANHLKSNEWVENSSDLPESTPSSSTLDMNEDAEGEVERVPKEAKSTESIDSGKKFDPGMTNSRGAMFSSELSG